MKTSTCNNLDKIIMFLLKNTNPLTLNDLYKQWMEINGKKELDKTDLMLIKYVLAKMCENKQVIYSNGRYYNKNLYDKEFSDSQFYRCIS